MIIDDTRLIISVLISCVVLFVAAQPTFAQAGEEMPSEEVISEAFVSAWTEGDLVELEEILAADFFPS